MRSIQEVGMEILNNTPAKFYVFAGSEYGIKKKYLSMLQNYYNGQCTEATYVKDIIDLMSTKHIVPLVPKLYIIRYDETFVSSLNESVANKINSLNIIGTIVCIYESEKHVNKLAKYLANYTVRIEDVSVSFKIKYLHADFPHLPDRLINLAAQHASNYQEAQLICASMAAVAPEALFALSDKDLMGLFGKSDSVSEEAIKTGVASRNFSYLVTLLDQYENVDSIFYTILATLLELEKVISNSHAQSSLREYIKRWTAEDIYNMFMNTYSAAIKSRSSSANADNKHIILYLFSLLKFQKIPSVEYMED